MEDMHHYIVEMKGNSKLEYSAYVSTPEEAIKKAVDNWFCLSDICKHKFIALVFKQPSNDHKDAIFGFVGEFDVEVTIPAPEFKYEIKKV